MTFAYDWIAHHARFAPESPALTDVNSARSYNYAAFDDRVARVAHYLWAGLGVKKGDRVCILAQNASEHFDLLFACRRLGVIFLPLNWRLALPELLFILEDSRPTCLITGHDFADTADRLVDRFPSLQVLQFDYGAASSYEQAITASPRLSESVDVALDDVWMILYTSGTSGRPKGALITHGMTFFSSVNAIQKLEITSMSRGLTFMPLFHAGGLFLYALWIFHFGGSNYVMRSFDAQLALDLLANREVSISHLLGVPTQFIMMSELPSFADANFDHVHTVTIGGAAAPVPLLERYLNKGIVLQQGWGMTETAAMATVLSKHMARTKIGSCGQPALHIAMRVVDPAGQDVEAGATGELLVKGPTVTPGYWNRPDESRLSIVDGWLKTGDAVRFDDDGYLYVVDRIKDMYISGGENVYPLEVENVIHAMPGVVEAAVIGVPDPKWGEVGRAFVVLRSSGEMSEADLLRYCSANLARYKVPKQVCFVNELPHNGAGKMLKHALPRD